MMIVLVAKKNCIISSISKSLASAFRYSISADDV